MSKNRLLVLANGPSLKAEYFPMFQDIPCLGMNAAYRFWDRIGWYPDIYCCLDDQVVLSHAEEIVRLIEQERCKIFFLHHNVLTRYNFLVKYQNVYYLPSLCKGEINARRCDKFGLMHQPSHFFDSTNPSKLTTGSYSVRFAGFLGYREIGLIGIDCRYTEVISEAKSIGGTVLEIVEQPEKNPNYFFDDYQIEGDRYNIPNPVAHKGNLHLQSFEVLRDDIRKYNLDVSVQVCTSESELFDRRIFSYTPIHSFVYPKRLSAVFIPCVEGELNKILSNLQLWNQPGFAPYIVDPQKPRVELHVALNKERNAEFEHAVRRVFHACNRVKNAFSRLEFHYSALEGVRDLYTRTFSEKFGAEGYMAGPNNQFFDIIEKFSGGMSYIVIFEPDVFPIRPNWLERLERFVQSSEEFWIAGSHYRGIGKIKSITHINGNAIYNVGSLTFQEFYHNSFKPYFYRRVKNAPHVCYDIVLDDMFETVYLRSAKHSLINLWKDTVHRFRYIELIVNIAHEEDRQSGHWHSVDQLRKRFPDAFLVHGPQRFLFPSADELATEGERPARSEETRNKALNTTVISIDPDAVNHFGHYLAYDVMIGETCEHLGLDSVIFGRRDIETDCIPRQIRFRRVFSDHSWDIGNCGEIVPEERIKRFHGELGEALSAHYAETVNGKTILYMYCGGLSHVDVFDEIVREFPYIFACVNLFWLPFTDFESSSFAKRWKPRLERWLTNEALKLTVPTHELARDLEAAIGIRLDVAPHPSTTVSDAFFHESEVWRRSHFELTLPVTVLFAGGVRDDKNFQLTANVVSALGNVEASSTYECVVRYFESSSTPHHLRKLGNRLRDLADVVSGGLDPQQFADLVKSADIVVLPYGVEAFRRRTSGLLIDALYFGVPVVVVRGTWLGNLVERFGCGIAISSVDVSSVIEAIDSIRIDYGKYRSAACAAAEAIFANNSWKRLVSSFVEAFDAGERRRYTSQNNDTTSSEDNDIAQRIVTSEAGEAAATPRSAAERATSPEPSEPVCDKVGAPAPTDRGAKAGKAAAQAATQIDGAPLAGEYLRHDHAYIDETRLVFELLSDRPAKSVMIDVGAHFGGSLLRFAKKGWRVFAFEPDPVNREKLLSRIQGLETVRVDPRAVSDRVQGELPFYSSVVSSGISALNPFHSSHEEACRVSTTTIADICAEHGLKAIDFLKIDAEGHDLMVLNRVPWDQIKPRVIECEYEDAKTVPLGYRFDDLARILVDKGYTVLVSEWHPVIRYGIKHDWRRLARYPCRLADPKSWGNLIAFREPPDLDAVAAIAQRIVTSEAGEAAATPRSAAERATSSEPTEPVCDKVGVPAPADRGAKAGKAARMREPQETLYQRFASYLIHHHPTLARIARFGLWSLRKLKERMFGLGGVALLSIGGLFAGAVISEPYRWLFAGAGAGLLLVLAGGLALGYAQFLFYRFAESQRREMQATSERVSRQLKQETAELRGSLAALEARIASLTKEVEGLSSRQARAEGDMSDVRENLMQQMSSLTSKLDAVDSTLADISARDVVRQDALNALREELSETTNRLAVMPEEISAFKQKVAGLSDTEKLLQQSVAALEQEAKSLHKAIENTAKTNATLKAEVEDALGSVKAQSDVASKQIATLSARVEQDMAYQRFNRVLTAAQAETVQKVWSKRLGVKATNSSLAYMANRIRVLEQNAVGRLATSIEDAVLRTLVSSAVRAKKLEVLEIGTLFGIGLIMIYDYNRDRYDEVHLTTIDPLYGYYNEKERDVLLNIPVTQATFWRNMEKAGVPREDVTLIDALSTADEAIERAGTKQYDVLIIDANHSYAGVKADFENYKHFVRRSGFIIFDDYGSDDWPDVQRFVDEGVMKREELAFVGAEWRTAVFQVVKTAGPVFNSA